MSDVVNFWMHSVSVVVIAKFHNPSILNKDFLANNKIVDHDWRTIETLSTPAVSVIQYDNGIKWILDQERLDISREYGMPLENVQEEDIHRLANSYIQKLPHVPYQAIGLNCVVSFEKREPLKWLTETFLKSKQTRNGTVMMPRFVVQTDKAALNLNFGGRIVNMDGKEIPSVIIDCNLHHDGPFTSVEDIKSVLSGWKDSQNTILTELNGILENV